MLPPVAEKIIAPDAFFLRKLGALITVRPSQQPPGVPAAVVAITATAMPAAAAAAAATTFPIAAITGRPPGSRPHPVKPCRCRLFFVEALAPLHLFPQPLLLQLVLALLVVKVSLLSTVHQQ